MKRPGLSHDEVVEVIARLLDKAREDFRRGDQHSDGIALGRYLAAYHLAVGISRYDLVPQDHIELMPHIKDAA